MSDKDPITDEEWAKGVAIERWLEANAPEAYREAKVNRVYSLSMDPPSSEEKRKNDRHSAAVAQCRKVLVEALERKEIDLRTLDPPDSSLAQWESFPDHTQRAIAADWTCNIFSQPGKEYLKHLRGYVFVLVFLRDRKVMRDKKNAEVCTKLLKEVLRLWEEAGKPRARHAKPHFKNEFEQQLKKEGLSTTNSDRVFNDTWEIVMPKEWKERGRKGRRFNKS